MIFFQRWKKSPHEGFWIFIPFLGDVGRAKRKEKKSKIHYLFSIFRASSPFLNFLCYGFGGTMILYLLILLISYFLFSVSFILLFLFWSFFCKISGFAIFVVGRLLLTLDKIRCKNSWQVSCPTSILVQSVAYSDLVYHFIYGWVSIILILLFVFSYGRSILPTFN